MIQVQLKSMKNCLGLCHCVTGSYKPKSNVKYKKLSFMELG